MCATALQLRPGSTPIIPTPIGVSVIVLLLAGSTAPAAADPLASAVPLPLDAPVIRAHFACESRHGLTSYNECSSALNNSHMNNVAKKIYWMASRARFSFWESTAASLLPTSWSTALTTGSRPPAVSVRAPSLPRGQPFGRMDH